MIYRVFLEDELDTPYPLGKLENCFRISFGSMNAWTYTNPNWMPTIKEQLNALGSGIYIGSPLEKIDGHLTIEQDGTVIGIVHSPRELPEKTYLLAEQQAKELRACLEKEEGKPYIFIDISSRGDKKLAESLATIINREIIENPCILGHPSSCFDIGD